MTESEQLESLRTMIELAERIVVFTGAGISTESGIPDFRGPQGVWKSKPPIDSVSYTHLRAHETDS